MPPRASQVKAARPAHVLSLDLEAACGPVLRLRRRHLPNVRSPPVRARQPEVAPRNEGLQTFKIQTSSGYSATGVLAGGYIQITSGRHELRERVCRSRSRSARFKPR